MPGGEASFVREGLFVPLLRLGERLILNILLHIDQLVLQNQKAGLNLGRPLQLVAGEEKREQAGRSSGSGEGPRQWSGSSSALA